MIARHWRGLVATEHADTYLHHLRTEKVPLLATLSGFVRASILRRAVDEGTEFLVLTVWESLAAVRQFTGPDVDTAVVPDKVRAWMIEYDHQVRHYDIVV